MKKILSIISAGILLLLVSCNTEKTSHTSEKAQKNLDSFHGITKAIESGDVSKLGDYMADDVVDHAGETGPITGIENIKAQFAKYREQSENMKTEVIKELADDDYVMAWLRFTGKMKMDAMGMKKGDDYNTTAIEVARFENGKCKEHWTFIDPAEMMKMMGGTPPATAPAANDPKDTTAN